MPDLIAHGPVPADPWRKPLPTGETVVLGRDAGAWSFPHEPFLSSRHVELTWRGGRLRVRKLESAANAVYFNGTPTDAFDVPVGGGFVVGRTLFTVSETRAIASPDAPRVESRAIPHAALDALKFRDAPHRLDVLSKLPDVISGATNDADMFGRLVDMLLAGIPRADVAAVVSVDPGGTDAATVRVLHWDRRRHPGERRFDPSRRLVTEAVVNQQQTVLHVWSAPAAEVAEGFTWQGQHDWAFCCPLPGEACRGWGLYVAGHFTGDAASTLLGPLPSNELRDDVKFTELVADILGSLRQVQQLRQRQAVFSRFFSPGVMSILAGGDAPRNLEPRETDITVLFCDLRGFSRKVEEASGNLLDILNRVSLALGVMTTNILDNRGAIADFLGDAAMGFWGWPLDEPGKVEFACRAALGIRAHFENVAADPANPLYGFRVGVGIASGRAVAGGIGTPEQAKVTVFGPVVNLAARLQDMTKLLRVPILIDEPTAAVVREHMPPDVARVRRLATVRPYGLDTPLTVTELIPPPGVQSVLTDEDVSSYNAALDAFLAGDWTTAYEFLHRVPPQDQGKDLLTRFILEHKRTPPPAWDGVIPLTTKS
jgi:adenylate cyclase